MTVLKHWFHVWRRTERPIEIKRITSFVNGPSVIVPFAHEIDLFPQILSVIADPKMTCLAIGRHPPGIAQPECPCLWSNSFSSHKWIVGWDGVHSTGVRMIN